MDNTKNVLNKHLGVNKIGKSMRKSPLHQPNFSNNAARQQPQPQPQVYNISKNEFKNIVQQLTGSPSQEPLPRPPQNPQKPQIMRLQRIRPPPLSPINPHQTPPPSVNNSFTGPFPREISGQPPLQPPVQSQIVAQLSADNPTMLPNLPSPTSQFLLPSPSFYSNSLSSLLSPGIGFSPMLSPNFSFSPLANPPSPSLFPLSPSGFF